MRRLRDSGMAILFVTHFLDQVYAVSDRITVLRNGQLVGEYAAKDLDHAALVAAMVGRTHQQGSAATDKPRAAETQSQTPVVQTTEIARRGSVAAVNLEIRPAKILGSRAC
jgi:simple sugar transport system ATP-binding protein